MGRQDRTEGTQVESTKRGNEVTKECDTGMCRLVVYMRGDDNIVWKSLNEKKVCQE